MKKIVTVLLLLGVLCAGGCSKKKSSTMKLKADVDSVAYVIGMNVGMNLLRMDSTLNVNAVCEGVRDAFNQVPKMTPEEAEAFFLRYQNYALPDKARAYEEQFLADIAKSNRAYARSNSGLTYTVESVGDQDRVPTSDRDSVVLRWVIRTADNAQVASSYEKGDSVYSMLENLRPGVRESVKLIGKGGKITAWLPAAIAYGAEGDSQLGIEPNATLCYEIELIEVDKYANRASRVNFR